MLAWWPLRDMLTRKTDWNPWITTYASVCCYVTELCGFSMSNQRIGLSLPFLTGIADMIHHWHSLIWWIFRTPHTHAEGLSDRGPTRDSGREGVWSGNEVPQKLVRPTAGGVLHRNRICDVIMDIKLSVVFLHQICQSISLTCFTC